MGSTQKNWKKSAPAAQISYGPDLEIFCVTRNQQHVEKMRVGDFGGTGHLPHKKSEGLQQQVKESRCDRKSWIQAQKRRRAEDFFRLSTV